MEEILYLECYSGISGDMTVAALLDLGADQAVLKRALDSLKIDGFQTQISRVKKSGIDACDFTVLLDEKHENHDHDMKYLYGIDDRNVTLHSHEHEHGKTDTLHIHEHEHGKTDTLYSHEDEHEHGKTDILHSHDSHEDEHEHGKTDTLHGHEDEHEHGKTDILHGHEHTHEHRNMSEIIDIIQTADISQNAKNLAKNIFEIVGQAEAKAHGIQLQQVHFHEVGAVDSIVDIIAAAVCLDNLNVKTAVIPVLYEGSGFVRCQHGMIPVPVPAVLNIINAHDITLHLTGEKGEFVTPTGAAIVAAIKTTDKLPLQFKVSRIGIGAGKRNYEKPSLLRAMILEY